MVDGPTQISFTSNAPIERPYWDSSLFVAHVKGERMLGANGLERAEIVTRLMTDAQAGKFKVLTSFATLAEVRRIKAKDETLDQKELDVIKALFESSWIVPIEVNREVAEKAQSIGVRYLISPLDSIHVASAIYAKCDVLFAWDKPLQSKLPPEIEGVTISEPYWEGTLQLGDPETGR